MCKTIVVGCCLLSSLVLYADPVELKGEFTFGYNFDSDTAWSDGKPAEAGKDYRVSNGYAMQVGYGNTSQAFDFPGDSLAIGDVEGSSGVFRHSGAAVINISNFILAKGKYVTYIADSLYGSQYSTLNGKATIASLVGSQFVVEIGGRIYGGLVKHLGLKWNMEMLGSAGSGLTFTGNGDDIPGRVDILSSSPSYQGSIFVSKKDFTLGIAASDSLGGVLPEFNEKAFVLAEQATLESLNAGIELKAAANRGMYVESSGGRVNTPSGMDLTIGWPILGEGVLTKSGAGTLYAANTVAVAKVLLAEGTLAAAPGTTVSISKVTLDGGVLGAGVGCGVLAPSAVEVANGGRILVKLLGSADAGTVIPFLKAKKGTFDKNDFYVCAGTGTYGAPFARMTSTVEGETETFSLVAVPVVETAAERPANDSYLPLEGSHWSDGNPVHSEAAYLVKSSTAAKTFLIDNSVSEYVFPGQSLTLAGASGYPAKLSVSSEAFEGNLRFYDYTRVGLEHTQPVFKGNMEINTSIRSDNGLMITVNADVKATIESVVSGSGWIYFNNYSGANTVGTVEFTGTNTYTGGMYLYGGNKFVCLRISNERNLGANPPTLNAESLYLDKGAVLHPKGSVTIDDPNRGIRLNGENRVVTDEGETTSILSPVYAYSSILSISGGGTLAIGGECINRPNDSETSFIVEDGFVKAGTARMFDFVKFTFGARSGLAVDLVTDAADARSQYGTILTNTATVFASSPLQLRVDHNGDLPTYENPVPVITVPESLAATLGGNVEFVDNLDMGKWHLVRDSVTVDGNPFVRYSARYEKGFAIILR